MRCSILSTIDRVFCCLPLGILNIKYSVCRRRIPGFEQSDRNVVHRDTRSNGSVRLAIVSVSVEDKVGTVAVNHLCQPRTAEKRKNLRSLALHRGNDGKVMEDYDSFRGAQFRHGALQLDCFVNSDPNKSLDFRLAEGG